MERVRREAQAMGRLGDHPHIVTVYDIGDEDGRPFIVSPLRAVCDFDEALMYARRAGVGDAGRALPLLAAARQQFEEIGMTGWLRRADDLEAELV